MPFILAVYGITKCAKTEDKTYLSIKISYKDSTRLSQEHYKKIKGNIQNNMLCKTSWNVSFLETTVIHKIG